MLRVRDNGDRHRPGRCCRTCSTCSCRAPRGLDRVAGRPRSRPVAGADADGAARRHRERAQRRARAAAASSPCGCPSTAGRSPTPASGRTSARGAVARRRGRGAVLVVDDNRDAAAMIADPARAAPGTTCVSRTIRRRRCRRPPLSPADRHPRHRPAGDGRLRAGARAARPAGRGHADPGRAHAATARSRTSAAATRPALSATSSSPSTPGGCWSSSTRSARPDRAPPQARASCSGVDTPSSASSRRLVGSPPP